MIHIKKAGRSMDGPIMSYTAMAFGEPERLCVLLNNESSYSTSPTMVEAEILEFVPDSGEYEEVVFGSSKNANDLKWVKFTTTNGEEWCGKFKTGLTPNSRIFVLVDNTCIVLAGGAVYGLHVNEKKLFSELPMNDLEDLIVNDELRHIVATDGLQLFLVSKTVIDIVWQSERFSIDGVALEKVEGTAVHGRFNDLSPEWGDFVFYTEERRVESEWLLKEHGPR